MAKNVFQKKKRIAHFQQAGDNFTEGENENVLSGCLDYVSSIIQNMDSNFNSVHSICSKDQAKAKLLNINKQGDNSSYNHAASTSNENSSQNQKNSSKLKKFSLSRKFPLMEKSQKVLKQLKHNRSVPKPRAHLSALPKSPLKLKPVHNACKISNAKKKKQREKGVSKLKNNAHVSVCDSPDVNKNFKMNKNKISKNSLKTESCKERGNNEFKDLNIHATISGLCDANVNSRSASLNQEKYGVCNTGSKESEDDTTDSEYERFVEKSKKGLKKKVFKRQKYSVAKTSKRASRKKLKNKLLRKNMSEECDSDNYGNDALVSLSSRFKRTSPFKKQKFTHDVLSEIETSNFIIEESEPDLNVDDYTRDSSSESDASDAEVSITNRTELGEKNVCSALLQSDSWSATSGVFPGTILPNVNTCINKDVSETCHLIPNSIVPNKDSPGTFLLGINSRKTEPNDLSNVLVIDLCDSDDDCKNTMSHALPAVSVPKEDKCKTTDVVNNLCVSGHDSTNVRSEFHAVSIQKEDKCVITNVPQNIDQSDSEGSDLEVIKVIPFLPKRSECIINNVVNNKEKCPVVHNYLESNVDVKHSNAENDDKANSDNKYNTKVISVLSKRSECIINNVVNTKEKCPVVHNYIKSNVDVKHSIAENDDKANSDNKYDAVYITNICNDFNQDKQIKTELVTSDQNIVLNSESRKQLDVLLDDNVLKKTIKRETFDDDIIILDSVKNEISSDKSLKMDMKCCQCQNHSDFLINIDKRNANFSECSLKNLSSLEGKSGTECICSNSKNVAFIENEIKFYKDICSNSKINHKISSSEIYGRKEDFQEIKQMSLTHLLELYKKEFRAYQEIIRTEESVEASLKLIENDQAEKLKYIRMLVQQYVGNNRNSSETFDGSMKEKGDKKDVIFKNQDIDTIKTSTGERASVFSLINLSNDMENSTPSSSLFHQTNVLPSKVEKDKKPDKCKLVELQTIFQCDVKPKLEVESSLKDLNSSRSLSGEKQTLKLLKEKCNVCGKEAMAACQRCAKVFFCSHECGRKFWNDGHENECGK